MTQIFQKANKCKLYQMAFKYKIFQPAYNGKIFKRTYDDKIYQQDRMAKYPSRHTRHKFKNKKSVEINDKTSLRNDKISQRTNNGIILQHARTKYRRPFSAGIQKQTFQLAHDDKVSQKAYNSTIFQTDTSSNRLNISASIQ